MRRVPVAHGSAGAALSITALSITALSVTAVPMVTGSIATGPAAAAEVPPSLAAADLRMELTGPSRRVRTGSVVDYAVRLRNAGPAAVSDAAAKVRLPRGIAVIEVSDPRCRERGRTLRCAPAALAAGTSRTVHILGIVKPSAHGSYRVRARTYARSAADPVLRNNQARAVMRVAPSTDVAVRVSAPRRMPPDGRLTLAVTVVNRGPRPARRVRVHLGAHGARLAKPWRSWDTACRVTGGKAGGSAGGHFLRCSLGDLAVGARRTLYVRARFSPAARALVQEYAITASHRLGDRRPANNTVTARLRGARVR
ncbi:hypothetical protein SMC26_15465 [Actinomadura fulvescens]|uniref:DUF11 domain-containing protein n=1 Tax=Actinomadura fulvescens TaxID=46160 RepID=A0ABP6D3E5_9ACTN